MYRLIAVAVTGLLIGGTVQGWRMSARIEAARAEAAETHADDLAAALAQRDAATARTNAANAALAEAERALLVAQGERDTAQRRLIDELETDAGLSGAGIPADRLQSIQQHWAGGGR
ncbi:hypothetical protein RPE78_09185 [Thioclava litoralis]|uniref:Phage lysis regulatory protein, LysB family n=1 Tax=Thioclava litoralis TaxID=3076557 RepID=A0ABZ1DYC5_9RHOB|nr:hypothetical protein RPE78_09185 [Thioclava sp. FTW29]